MRRLAGCRSGRLVMLTGIYRPAQRVAVDATLAPLVFGPRDPAARRDARGWWLAFRTPEGDATLRLTESAHGIAGSAWGPGPAPPSTRCRGCSAPMTTRPDSTPRGIR
ncbi:hypothetical protein [Pseudolysinimonas kribbensis]|nr:hypothetical protein [Pseudolysinimonas kribbensis]